MIDLEKTMDKWREKSEIQRELERFCEVLFPCKKMDFLKWFEPKVEEFPDIPNHFVDDNKKVAVSAPEPWMKEKVAKVWGVSPHQAGIKENDYVIGLYVFPSYNTSAGDVLSGFDDWDNFPDLQKVSFQDFCKEHGISDKPDYVWINTKEGWKITGDVKYGLNNGELWVDTPLNEHGTTFHFKPATEKEYLEQEGKEPPQYDWDDVLSSKYVFGPEKPKLKLHEEWGILGDNLAIQEDINSENDFLLGLEYMQKAIHDRALEVYDAHEGRISWATVCEVAIEEMKQGKIKPPKEYV